MRQERRCQDDLSRQRGSFYQYFSSLPSSLLNFYCSYSCIRSARFLSSRMTFISYSCLRFSLTSFWISCSRYRFLSFPRAIYAVSSLFSAFLVYSSVQQSLSRLAIFNVRVWTCISSCLWLSQRICSSISFLSNQQRSLGSFLSTVRLCYSGASLEGIPYCLIAMICLMAKSKYSTKLSFNQMSLLRLTSLCTELILSQRKSIFYDSQQGGSSILLIKLITQAANIIMQGTPPKVKTSFQDFRQYCMQMAELLCAIPGYMGKYCVSSHPLLRQHDGEYLLIEYKDEHKYIKINILYSLAYQIPVLYFMAYELDTSRPLQAHQLSSQFSQLATGAALSADNEATGVFVSQNPITRDYMYTLHSCELSLDIRYLVPFYLSLLDLHPEVVLQGS